MKSRRFPASLATPAAVWVQRGLLEGPPIPHSIDRHQQDWSAWYGCLKLEIGEMGDQEAMIS
jgi:hypothetical protein